MTERQFTPSWSVQELEACFIVKDGAGQKLAFVYFEEEPGRRAAAKLLRQRARNLGFKPEAERGSRFSTRNVACSWAPWRRGLSRGGCIDNSALTVASFAQGPHFTILGTRFPSNGSFDSSRALDSMAELQKASARRHTENV